MSLKNPSRLTNVPTAQMDWLKDLPAQGLNALQTLQWLNLWTGQGLLRHIDSAFAAQVLRLNAEAPAPLLVAAAVLAHMEGRGHTCLAVADLSFISLALVLPALGALLAPGRREALLLVKPQFEVGRSRVGKGGVVRDPVAHVDAIEGVIRAGAALGWQGLGLVASPITGPAGNHEYLLWLGSGLGSDENGDGGGDGDGGAGGLNGPLIRALVAQTLASP